MIVEDIIRFIENWAPPGAAWDKDNVGVQVGSRLTEVKKILICLELTEEVIRQAIKQNCNLIITHHPFIFQPLKKIETNKNTGQLIELLIKNDITLYSAHTNLDFTKDGVSFATANKLGLVNTEFLLNQDSNQFKIIIFVPENNLEDLMNSVFNAGGGVIGNYEKCSFRMKGTGTFKGNENSNPALGRKENFENVDEVRLEIICDKWNKNKVINAIYNSHPYEEPAFDIYKLENSNSNYGYGVFGELPEALNLQEFIKHTADKLGCNGLRYTEGKQEKIKKVALCGGSGSDLFDAAISKNADAFITADIKYHSFHDAWGKILLIDAGHYETEIHITEIIKKKLDKFIKQRKEKIPVAKFSGSTNPVKFYKI